MTDNEIKCEKCFHKSVCEKKTCAECQGLYCDECELYDLYNGVPYIENCEKFIDADLINRQKAEIEKLQADNSSMQSTLAKMSMGLEEAKAEAIKEFAEQAKHRLCLSGDYLEELDNLVKEMTEPSLLDKKIGGDTE